MVMGIRFLPYLALLAVVAVGGVAIWNFYLRGPAPLTEVAADAAGDQELTPAQIEAIQEVIRDYLVNNPEIIREAITKLRASQRTAARQARRQTVGAKRKELLNDPGSPVAGNPDSDVTVVEFFDYRCPYCKGTAPDLKRLREEDDIRFVYKEFPILGPQSVFAARAALAARGQGKYFAFHDALMEVKGGLDEAAVMEVAKGVGLDTERLRRDMTAPEIDAVLKRNFRLAQVLNVTGTPAFVIGDELVPGAVGLATLRAYVRQARRKASAKR